MIGSRNREYLETCPRCEFKFESPTSYCPHCSLEIACKACGNLKYPLEKYCSNCGTYMPISIIVRKAPPWLYDYYDRKIHLEGPEGIKPPWFLVLRKERGQETFTYLRNPKPIIPSDDSPPNTITFCIGQDKVGWETYHHQIRQYKKWTDENDLILKQWTNMARPTKESDKFLKKRIRPHYGKRVERPFLAHKIAEWKEDSWKYPSVKGLLRITWGFV